MAPKCFTVLFCLPVENLGQAEYEVGVSHHAAEASRNDFSASSYFSIRGRALRLFVVVGRSWLAGMSLRNSAQRVISAFSMTPSEIEMDEGEVGMAILGALSAARASPVLPVRRGLAHIR